MISLYNARCSPLTSSALQQSYKDNQTSGSQTYSARDRYPYVSGWLVGYETQKHMVTTTVNTSTSWSFQINLEKSQMVPSQTVQWGILWDTSVWQELSQDNRVPMLRKLFVAQISITFTKRKWESLLGSQLCCRGRLDGQTPTSFYESTRSSSNFLETMSFTSPANSICKTESFLPF